MRRTNTKTSLSVTLEPDGGALINMKWSDADVEQKGEASRAIIRELAKVPDYQWLAILVPQVRVK